jgi:hypothetical protein
MDQVRKNLKKEVATTTTVVETKPIPKASNRNPPAPRAAKTTVSKKLDDRLGPKKKSIEERLGRTVIERLGAPLPKGSIVTSSGLILAPKPPTIAQRLGSKGSLVRRSVRISRR